MADRTEDAVRALASTLGANLALAREAAGLTQHELASRARTSRATISQIEAGAADPRLSTLTALATALGVSPFVLLLGWEEVEGLTHACHESAKEPSPLTPEEIVELERLTLSRVSNENRQGARLAATCVRRLGYRTSGAAVGAAIATAFLPTAASLLLGAAIGRIRGQER